MFTLDNLRQFHAWTHQSVSVLLDHLAIFSADDYTTDLPGFGYPNLRAQMVHLLGCEMRWVRRLQALPLGNWDPHQWPAVSDARTLQSDARTVTLDYLAGLTDQQLNTPAEIRFSASDVIVRTPALVFHHVFTHAFHHKGQMVAMCRLLGDPAPDTGLNNFE